MSKWYRHFIFISVNSWFYIWSRVFPKAQNTNYSFKLNFAELLIKLRLSVLKQLKWVDWKSRWFPQIWVQSLELLFFLWSRVQVAVNSLNKLPVPQSAERRHLFSCVQKDFTVGQRSRCCSVCSQVFYEWPHAAWRSSSSFPHRFFPWCDRKSLIRTEVHCFSWYRTYRL